MDKNLSEKDLQKATISHLNLSDKNSHILTYSYKKSSKLMSVIFVVTDSFIGQQLLKDSIRDTALRVVRDILGIMSGNDFKLGISSLEANILLINSLVETFVVTRSIDSKIGEILCDEYRDLLSLVLTVEVVNHGFKNSPYAVNSIEELFRQIDGDKEIFEKKRSTNKEIHPLTLREKTIGRDSSNQNTSTQHLRNTPKFLSGEYTQRSETEKDMKREKMALEVISKGHGLGIKDISLVFPDVSEKTVQRLLISMLEKGLIRKEGERRWSRYYTL